MHVGHFGGLLAPQLHSSTALWNGEVGENPTLTRNRELVSVLPPLQVSRITTHKAFFTTRRGLRGGIFFRRRELLFSLKGSHAQQECVSQKIFSNHHCNSALSQLNIFALAITLCYWVPILGILPSSIWRNNLDSRNDWTFSGS